jgi:proteasome accessory factor C
VKVISVVGNRPQFIKSAPLSVALRERGIDEVVVHSGQHYDRELSQVFFDELGLEEPHHRLDLHTADPEAMEPPILALAEREAPDAVLVYGDTNTTLAGARAGVLAGAPVAHVEAGLRSGDLEMPEERNRIEVDRLSRLLLAPDERSRETLLAEDVAGRIEVVGDTAWWVERTYGEVGRVEDGVFVTPYSSIPLLASWILRQDGRAIPLEPDELRREVADAVRKVRAAHEGELPRVAREAAVAVENGTGDRPAGPVVPERFAVLQALLAYLLAECGDESSAEIPAQELIDRFRIPEDALEEHLSLLNLVNFGGGCYTVYAELRGDTVFVDKELYGETFRAAPRLTPLEARAIRLALEFVGPMIAADANTPLERVRRKLEETFGEFELAQTPQPHVDVAEEDLVGKLTDGIRERRLVEVEYLKEGEETPSTRMVEPYALERRLPHWYVHTWDRTSDGERSFRLDRMRSARLTRDKFEPREGFEPRGLRDSRHARIWYSKAIARWRVERGDARALADGAAISEAPVGSKEWLLGEIFSYRGEAIVLEPEDLRRDVASHAKALAQELGVARLRARA